MEIADDLFGRTITQFALFLENRVGKLLSVVNVLAREDAHILAFSVNESSDHAVIRMIVDKPETARGVMMDVGIPLVETSVIAVELSEDRTGLEEVTRILLQAEVNIMYAYPLLVRSRRRPVVALHVDNDEYAIQVLQEQGMYVLSQDDIAAGMDS
ncbi:MAG: acetolactate synthase [Planctomycetota bacterium]|jgi:hypothetical protein|nr:acetolactate synthase [Planctomycetota bacterium]MDP6504531.1 acetolactate synthase [Planctomycetota bacterium]